ncbi:dihydrolipoamide acetyltransferase family protein [Streptomyces coffeae]|uniref:Dihydrolipoamide acetyltransferase component of pyruvate dehydrogenase complex n=1 Tax=Streptomyces coffeae TaxID=621382 RepID=A0ABS1NLA9_9ACTN|nr:dihydrolipoamide acetyltransferase family protein [Streptomyces coffeae]MBL1100879.1 2-oxo acid dehydrogenase subunit E2 [Streptomyces coffeae]
MTETATHLSEFRMPDVGEGLTEAEILAWYVQPGDRVTDGQVVCEIETAKAVVELPIPFDGVVRELRFAEGETVEVGAVIIAVADAGDAEPHGGPEPRPEDRAGEARAVPDPSGEREPVLVGYGVAPGASRRRPRRAGSSHPPPDPSARKVRAKPPVRKLAKDLGVDLTTVSPTGPDGVITREDIHAAAIRAGSALSTPTRLISAAADPAEQETRIPVTGVRRATAAAVTSSAFTAPHVTEFMTVDVTRTMKLVRELRCEPGFDSLHITPLLIAARAVLTAVARNPGVNAAWDEAAQEIVLKHHVNLGIAAATPRGLLVPNIKNAQALSLAGLAEALDSLVDAARAGRTTPADMTGGTLTLTNIGVFGVDAGTPILNPGEAAILAIGAIRPRPWIHRGKVKSRQVLTLALSFDHRLIDGELGSRFLADVAAVLERPHRLIAWC